MLTEHAVLRTLLLGCWLLFVAAAVLPQTSARPRLAAW
jgi:hypothetical protein